MRYFNKNSKAFFEKLTYISIALSTMSLHVWMFKPVSRISLIFPTPASFLIGNEFMNF